METTVALIVVADDDDDLRPLMELMLERDGHTVVAKVDGAAALQAVREHRPDAVVSDIDMPHMSGIELCAAIRADPELAHLPVVLASGSILPQDNRPAEAQATAMLRKPFLGRDLVACVNKALAVGHVGGQPPAQCP
jgi:CheY-like chemotaxis protein